MGWIKRKYICFENNWQSSFKRKKLGIFLCVYTALFLITFLLAYSPFLLAGKSFILDSDGRNQHYPAMVYVGRYLRKLVMNLASGQVSVPLFDINIGLGADIITTLNYYGFGDPLYLLTLFVPTKYTEYLYNFLAIFKMYLAGLSFAALCRYHKKPLSHLLIGSFMYTFSGYAIYTAIRHPEFTNPMIQLPLLIIGIDLIIRHKNPLLFVLAIFYSALCGFYCLYMMTIMLGIYAVVRFFSLVTADRLSEFIHMLCRIISNYLWGIGLAAIFILPSIVGFFTSSRYGETIERNYYSYGWSYYRNNALRLIGAAPSWNAISLAAIALFAIVLLFYKKEKQTRVLKVLFLFAVTIYAIPLGGYLMNGFGYPSQRWTYGVALLISYIVVQMMPTLFSLDQRQKLVCFSVTIIYAFCAFSGPKNRGVYYVTGIATLAITLIGLLLLKDIVSYIGVNSIFRIHVIFFAVVVILIIGNVSVNAIYKFAEDQENYIASFTEYGAETERLESSLVREAEPYLKKGAGRFESSSFSRNAGMVWRVPTLNSYWAMTNKYISDLWQKTENIQLGNSVFNIYGTDQRTITNALFSTQYFIDKENRAEYLPYGYSCIKQTDTGNLIYKNGFALPWGYTYDNYISYKDLENLSGLEVEECMLQSIALEEKLEGIQEGDPKSYIQDIPYEIAETRDILWENGTIKVKKDGATIKLAFKLPALTEGYLRLRGLDINKSGQSSINVVVKCESISKSAVATSSKDNWYYGRTNFLYNLGYSDNERTSCTITISKKGTYKLEDLQLFALPMKEYSAQVEILRREPLENIKLETNKISGTINLSTSKILCMSIPYSRGWSAKVDGESVKILRGNIMFMALSLTPGYHEIEFTYCTPGLKAGVITSIVSLGILGLYSYRYKKRKVRK